MNEGIIYATIGQMTRTFGPGFRGMRCWHVQLGGYRMVDAGIRRVEGDDYEPQPIHVPCVAVVTEVPNAIGEPGDSLPWRWRSVNARAGQELRERLDARRTNLGWPVKKKVKRPVKLVPPRRPRRVRT